MHHVVEGLKWASFRDVGPFGKPRARGRRAAGLRYERAVAKALPMASHGRWIEYEDAIGHGWAQPDFICYYAPLFSDLTLVLEAKYTWTEVGHLQLEQLYLPLLKKVWPGRLLASAVVSKVLTPQMEGVRIAGCLEDVIRFASEDSKGRICLHYLGLGPLYRSPLVAPLPKAFEGSVPNP